MIGFFELPKYVHMWYCNNGAFYCDTVIVHALLYYIRTDTCEIVNVEGKGTGVLSYGQCVAYLYMRTYNHYGTVLYS